MGRSPATGMAMPETAVNEARRPETWKDEIGRAGKAPNMKPISEATRVQRSPQGELGFRISDGDARHDARAGGPIHGIGHRQSYSTPKLRRSSPLLCPRIARHTQMSDSTMTAWALVHCRPSWSFGPESRPNGRVASRRSSRSRIGHPLLRSRVSRGAWRLSPGREVRVLNSLRHGGRSRRDRILPTSAARRRPPAAARPPLYTSGEHGLYGAQPPRAR